MSGTQKLLAALITALALMALCVSSYLTWVTWQQSTVAGCTGGALVDCDEVLSSSASKWLGIPVSLLGATLYAGILALVWPAVLRGGWLMTGLLTLAMMAAGAGVWFIGNQAFVVQHFCLYCMAVHSCGLVICVLAILLMRATAGAGDYNPMQSYFAADNAVPYEEVPTNPLMPVIAAGIASVGLLALIGGQIFFAPSGMEVVDIPIPEQNANSDPQQQAVVEQSPEEQAPQIAADEEPAEEPAGEAVVASDEPETTDEAAAETEQGTDVATETSNQSFEALFGESPGDTMLTATSNSPVPRLFRFKYLKGDIDVENNPVLGNPYARARMVEMLDYTCPHCRKMHAFVKKAVDHYGDQFGVVIYHVPLSRKCNQLVKIDQTSHTNACDIARLAFGVWKLAPEKFPEFHEWLMTGDKAPPLHEVKSKAMALVGSNVLTDKSIDVESKRRVAEHAADMEALKVGLPILIFENGVIKGMPGSDQEWFQMLEQRLGVRPAATSVQN
jgi:uncharacterized membrane protein/protein-disulfide isomerase